MGNQMIKMKTLPPEKVKQGKELIAKISSLVEGGLSSVLYHWTPLYRGLINLKNNSYILNQPEDIKNKDPKYKGYRYLSTTRSKLGGYHIAENEGIIFVLDGNALRTKYKGSAFDYWHNFPKEPRPDDKRKVDEMEDRIFSKDEEIPLAKYTKEIHVMESKGKDHDKYIADIIDKATSLGVPCYLYKNATDWGNLNKARAQPMKIAAGLSSVLYHWTSLRQAASILESDTFKLGIQFRSGDRAGYYYMSTTRSKTGGFHVNRKGVIFVLDGTALGRKHKGEAIDYYADTQYARPAADTREGDEMEDRVLSKKPAIDHASKYIKEIHLCLSTNHIFTNEHYLGNVRNFIALAKQRGIPLYIYEFKDMLAWLNQDKRKSMPLEKFKVEARSRILASVEDFIEGIRDVVYSSNFLKKWASHYEDETEMMENFSFRSDHCKNIEDLRRLRSEELFDSIYHETKDEGDKIRIYRAIQVQNVNKFMEALKAGKTIAGFDGIGIYWSWDSKAADAHWGAGGHKLLIEALVPMNAIDFKETALLSMDNEEECEVRLLHNKDIEIVDVTQNGEELMDSEDSAIIVNTGSGKTKSKGQMHAEGHKIKASKYIDSFNNWVDLTDEQIKQEYEWEYISHQKHSGFNPWPTLEEFKAAVKDGDVETLTESADRNVGNRSRCEDLEDLKDLMSGYQFPRDVDRIVKGYTEGHAMPYPLILEQGSKRWVMSGNTRLDAAFIMGITPKVLVLRVPSFKEKVTSKYNIVLAENTAMFSKLKKVLSTNEAYAILDSAFPGGVDTWVAGGCYLLARALMRIAPNAELMVLRGLTKEQEQTKEFTEPQPEHVLIKLGSSLIDGDGVSTERALIRRWKKYEGLVGKCWVEPYNPAKHKAYYLDLGNTSTFKKAEVDLVAYLAKTLK